MNVNMKAFVLLVLGIGLLHIASAVTHSLRYFYTGTTGIPDFPEFVDVGVVNGKVISYYDSITKRKVPKQSWMEENLNQQYWNEGTDQLKGTEQSFKANIQIAQTRFNQTGGVHVFQNMYGCEWDDESGATEGFYQFGYDGEDFLAFDLKTTKWIAPTPQAVITKHKWDSNTADNEYKKNYFTQECIDWLKKYVDYGKSTLMRTVHPSVSLFQKTPSSPVTCRATGFYPSDVMVSWQKDGQDHHEDVEYGETLPNDDGTFQKSSHLTVTPEDRKNSKYQCLVQVKGIKEDFIGVLPGPDAPNFVPIIGGVVALLVIVAVVVGVVIWKKKSKKGFVPASTSDTSSENSGRAAQMT
ncbi:major histocompatibility complex class I-related gene protein-like [Salvelinus alpinus]|uniref:major histocompatibility complex class I-related gene protein-like n=1 Tax=Salvelinus alpinus TaxID=8036 RepID=UPI0039FD2CFA